MPNSQPQELITAQIIDDPFSVEFMEQAEQNPTVIHVSASSLPRRSRVARTKMVIQKELKARLLKLKSTNVPQVVKDIVDDILNLKYVPENTKYCNYIGLSQADYGKISYVDKDREERLKGQETIMQMIKPGTKVKIAFAKNFTRDGESPIYFKELTLNSRHLDNKVFPIREFVPITVDFQAHYLSGITETAQYTFNNAKLELDSDVFRILNSRLEGSSRIIVTQDGFDLSRLNSYWLTILGVEFENTQVRMKELWNFKKRYHTSVGKIIRRLFNDKYSDRDVTAFAESYASLITVSNPMYDFDIVEGTDIKDAYLDVNYAQQQGSLGNSCMRYTRCQSYFDMYTMYPDKVKMAVLRKGRKVAARALVWHIKDKWHYDRIYYINNETHNLLKNTLEAHGYQTIYSINELFQLEMDLSNVTQFPYVDTMCYYHPDSRILANRNLESHHYVLRSTSGHHEEYRYRSSAECYICGDEVHEDDVIYIDAGRHEGESCCSCCSVFSEAYDHTFTVQDDYVEIRGGDYILSRYAIELVDGSYIYDDHSELARYENDFGYFITDEGFNYYTINNLYYHPDDTARPAEAQSKEEVEKLFAEQRAQALSSNITSSNVTTITNGTINITDVISPITAWANFMVEENQPITEREAIEEIEEIELEVNTETQNPQDLI